jgi:hypothetical protein
VFFNRFGQLILTEPLGRYEIPAPDRHLAAGADESD